MKRETFTRALGLLCVLTSSTLLAADAPYNTTVFETVDGIGFYGSNYQIDITGIVRGEGTARTLYFYAEPNYTPIFGDMGKVCERYALTALSKPGQYYFEMRSYQDRSGSLIFQGCKLTRR